jgi:predicted ATPase/DNA-binding CsgD family transcriptional regulator/transcriptional regulator with XRE-family HTH domain
MPADLRERRLRLHLSQAALAEALGVARNTVARWERNELEIRHPELVQIALDRLEEAEPFAADKRSRSGRARSGTFDQQVRTYAPEEGDGSAPVRNFPHEFTSFIGREQEITAVRRLLSTTPLVTVSGAGGSGKTRFASQVARTLSERFPDGVYFIEFASLQFDELVPRAVASVLEVRERPDRPQQLTLQDAVRTRQLLLVLDNCEHLLEACARLIDTLLQAGPGIRILTTSREPLKVAGEVTWPLAPLSYPESSSNVAQVDLERFEATRLLVERARARHPDFVPSAADMSAIVSICQRLDGLPLAIELAAARLTALSCAQLATRLDEALPLLTTGVRTAPARQRTLRATVDWSHALLTPAEQVVFRRLAAFVGGWTLEAAESLVCADGSTTSSNNVLDLLQRLVDKSLVVREDGAGEPRFRFLETIRQYAAKRLAEAGEENLMRRRHLDWCVAMVVGLCGDGTTVVMADAFATLEQEHDNIRSALRWSIDAEDIETGLNLGAALYQFWYMHGHYSEGIARLTELLAHPKGRRPRRQRLSAMLGRGLLATLHGRYAEAQEWLADSLALADDLGDVDQKSSVLHHLAKVATYRGEPARARAYQEQALHIKREIGNKLGQVIALVELGKLDLVSGDAAGAAVHGQETLALARAEKFAWGEAGALLILGRVAHVQGDLARAQALLDKSLTLYRQLGHPQGIGFALTALGMLALGGRAPSRARDYLLEALTVVYRAGEALLIARLIEELGSLSARRNPVRVVTMAATASALRQKLGASASDPELSPEDHVRIEERLQVARRELGEPGFSAAWRAGQDLPVEEAIREAASVQADAVDAPVRTHLTAREHEVAALVAQGCTNQQIAARLVFTEATAKKHVEHILAKLEFKSRAQIVAWHLASQGQSRR